ncbi:DUF2187 domain-containing protein [Rossellomorea marisflavi]|uniref:DUF2187 domain-containing protein n=1 Tax=Rossellomorea marisflavi TaxID=189381 RepID=A0A5D4RFM8_9BACI|nr:DUF2187 family protein [Rossellomorea marisflavi]KQU57160.1 hypothetical protein ASG66_20430 [Bacillus sp. Leaf406]MBV6685664.1 YkvS family protein [Bacillus sp. JRC01]VXA97932.1 conserved hypothetical protein [Bacillus sp. 349Y]TYS49569.1 DUF2187 domain-containing protein [Rossellomorea marisflavi]WJV18692.1 DUF2187 family protein [Rossellomorea marisflavi]
MDNTFVYSKEYANLGDIIEFKRKKHVLQGVVTTLRENTVIVRMDKESAVKLDLPDDQTVVAHKNYAIIERAENGTNPVFVYDGWNSALKA